MAEKQNWPRCSACRSRDLLLGSSYYKCLDCDHTGSIAEIQDFWITGFVTGRSITTSKGNIGAHMQLGPYPQAARHDFGGILACRRQEMFRDDVCLRYWFKAVDHLSKHGQFSPAAIVWKSPLAKPEAVLALPKASDAFIESLRRNAVDADCVAVFFTSDDPEADFCNSPAPGDKYLVANLHHIGVAPQTLSLATSKIAGAKSQKDTFPTYNRKSPPMDLIYQPVDWRVLVPQYGQEQLRLALGFEIEGATSATFAVKEDMDTGAFTASASVRTPGNPLPVQSKIYDSVRTVDEAVVFMREKCSGMKEKMEEVAGKAASFHYDVECDAVDHHYASVAKIQEQPLWPDFLKAKLEADAESVS